MRSENEEGLDPLGFVQNSNWDVILIPVEIHGVFSASFML